MPHLQFEINRRISHEDKRKFADAVMALFANLMDTGTEHISISIRDCDTFDISLGRVSAPEQGLALVDADLRQGRTLEQRRELALGFVDLLRGHFAIPPEHVYITFTEHKGADFHLVERYLADWSEGEDPLSG